MEMEETGAAEERQETAPAPQRQPKRQPPPAREGRDKEPVDATFNEWIGQMSGSARDYKVKIERTEPMHADDGRMVGGWLAELEDFSEVDEAYVRNRWGGGRFVIHVFQRNMQGKWLFARRFPLKIAGEPRGTGSAKAEASPSPTVVRDENPRLQEKAMDHAMEIAKLDRSRA